MSPLPTARTCSGESWEVVETSRSAAAAELDWLIEATADCDCPNAPDALEHYDKLCAAGYAQWSTKPAALAGLLAEAVTRLAAARKADKS